MRFEPGKTYKTKSERKAYCIGENPLASVHSRWVFSTESGSVFAVSAKGKWRIDGLEDPYDIIGEWQEPVTVEVWCYAVIYKRTSNQVVLTYCSEKIAIAARDQDAKEGHRVSEIVKREYIVP